MDKKNIYDDSLNAINNFIESKDFEKIKNVISDTFNFTLDEISSAINKNRKNRNNVAGAMLKPVENAALVEQKPKEEKKALGNLRFWKFLFGLHIILSLIFIPIALSDADAKIVFFYMVPVLIGSFFGIKKSKNTYEKMVRFKKYLREFGSSTVVTISDLTFAVNESKDLVVSDLKEFVKKDYFKQGRLVENESIFILDKKTYDEYKQYSLNYESKPEMESANVENECIAQLISYENSLKEPVKTKVKELLLIVQKIFEDVKNNPEDKSSIDKFMVYYLPTTLKLLGEYKSLQSNVSELENTRIAMNEIEESLDIIIESFKKLLNNMYEDNVIDIKTDISVLKTMLKQEGLLNDDFK
ncbi:5-bromo-4-chloroindolyl phosphate hydrolysis family protein [Peptoniphilus sp. oral taxon 386]|uniref:5-bromo-4-chloroindolyl phosphate hydrolysis family protein n=1 Tax=Peptoniphilus sp. oral taxon 386 TaxID=652713 RepID=UPI0001DAA164|nr:5-bromo-4-chloroindolyl phosphate hydrolysis family protein [Peptoniphilus sp. oral taxon 386]EFI41693.1 hypothetical protein HMPREF0629_00317 [Peptoniphilus sp. oral taxon 386 str. F0131]